MVGQVQSITIPMPIGKPENFPENNASHLNFSNYLEAFCAMFDGKNGVEDIRWAQLATKITTSYFEITLENSDFLRFLASGPFFDFMKGFWSFYNVLSDVKDLSKVCEKDYKSPVQSITKYWTNISTDKIMAHFKADRTLDAQRNQVPADPTRDYSASGYWRDNWGSFDAKANIAEKSLALIVDALWAFNFAFSALAVFIAQFLPFFVPIAIIAETINVIIMILAICRIQGLIKPKIYAENEDYQKWENPVWKLDEQNPLNPRKFINDASDENITQSTLQQINRYTDLEIDSQNFELVMKVYYLAASIISIIGFCYLGAAAVIAFPIFKLIQLTIAQGIKNAKGFEQKIWDAEKSYILRVCNTECKSAETAYKNFIPNQPNPINDQLNDQPPAQDRAVSVFNVYYNPSESPALPIVNP